MDYTLDYILSILLNPFGVGALIGLFIGLSAADTNFLVGLTDVEAYASMACTEKVLLLFAWAIMGRTEEIGGFRYSAATESFLEGFMASYTTGVVLRHYGVDGIVDIIKRRGEHFYKLQ